MTVTITPRRAAMVVLAVIAFTIAYVMGAARSGGAAAVGTNLSGTAGTTQSASNLSPTASFPTVESPTTPPTGGPGIFVRGMAKVAGTPDTLRLDLSVVGTGASVSVALDSANRSAAAVQKSLLANGVQKKDLQTSGLNIQPEYEYPKSGRPVIKGYQVSESVSAKLRNLSRAGDAIGKAVTAGGNATRVNGISLDLEDTGALVSNARDKAFADAKAKAEQYAKAAGRALGAVVSITEDVSTPPTPTFMGAPSASEAKLAYSVPIQPGSQDVSVSVTVVYAMK